MNEKELKQREDFGRFFIEYYPKVKSFAMKILMEEEDAEDISQDIFLKLFDRPQIWYDKESRDGYLFRMTKNHIFNLIKRRSIERVFQQEVSMNLQLTDDLGIDDKLHVKEIELMIMYAVEQMPEQRRKVFKMSRYEGKSNVEISEILQMSVRTVERHIYLALADLKKITHFFT